MDHIVGRDPYFILKTKPSPSPSSQCVSNKNVIFPTDTQHYPRAETDTIYSIPDQHANTFPTSSGPQSLQQNPLTTPTPGLKAYYIPPIKHSHITTASKKNIPLQIPLFPSYRDAVYPSPPKENFATLIRPLYIPPTEHAPLTPFTGPFAYIDKSHCKLTLSLV